eukprot:4377381-Pyramimonas_sp.AAC.1
MCTEINGSDQDRTVERMLRNIHIPVPPGDAKKLDFSAPDINLARMRPLFAMSLLCHRSLAQTGHTLERIIRRASP